MHRWLPILAMNAALALIYFASAKFGLSLALAHSSATAVWPPTGLSIAAILLLGPRVWPGVLIGAFAANLTTDGNALTSAAIAVGNTLEAVFAGWAIRKFAGGSAAFDWPNTIFRYVGLVGAAAAISAIIGSAALTLAGSSERSVYFSLLLTWWLGDFVSAIVIAPLLVIWGRLGWERLTALRAFEAIVIASVAVAVGLTIFGGRIGFPLAYVSIPPLIWAAYRFELRGAVSVGALMECVAVSGTLAGRGPFAVNDPNTSLLLMQAFMAVSSLTALLVAAAVAQQRRTEIALAHHRDHLQELVEQRTVALKSADDRLRLAERMSAMGTLAAGLGHDMGNLLMPLRARLDMLERIDLPDQARHDVRAIRASADYLQRLSAGLRMLAMDPAGGPAVDTSDVRAWWSDAETVLRHALPRGVLLEAQLPASPVRLAISRPALMQIVFNLVQNAGDAMQPRGAGRVTISVDDDAIDPRRFKRLCVTDDGPGMTDEVRRRCLEPFFTTKPRGVSTGLGLTLVYSLVTRAGGEVSLESRPGAGSRFALRLPSAQAGPEAPHHGQGPKRIAVVDLRDPRLQAFVAGELRALAFEVTIGNPASANGTADLAVIDAEDAAARSSIHADSAVRVIIVGDPAMPIDPRRTLVLGRDPKASAIRDALQRFADTRDA